MIREFNPGTNDFDVFFEQFEFVVEAGLDVAQWRPGPGIRFIQPPTIVRLPYGQLDITGEPCEHQFARALIWHEGTIWSCRVCRACEHIAPPASPTEASEFLGYDCVIRKFDEEVGSG